jgi:hypothetical protein
VLANVKRISRIRRRASPAVREAFERGQISVRRADTLLYLPPAEQAVRLAKLLKDRNGRAHAYQTAANVIDDYLKERCGTKQIDLYELVGRNRSAHVR